MKKIIYSAEAPKPLGVYSQGTVGGGFIFVSGQLPVDPKTIPTLTLASQF